MKSIYRYLKLEVSRWLFKSCVCQECHEPVNVGVCLMMYNGKINNSLTKCNTCLIKHDGRSLEPWCISESDVNNPTLSMEMCLTQPMRTYRIHYKGLILFAGAGYFYYQDRKYNELGDICVDETKYLV